MNIRLLLESEHNKSTTESIVKCVYRNPHKLEELMDCFFDDNYRICQRASWPVGLIGEKSPEMLVPYLPAMLGNLDNPKHNAIIRNTVRSWQNLKIPEEYEGEIFEKCFNYILDTKAAIAIRAFSMSVCANIAANIPDLKEELIMAINDQMEMASPGIRSRGSKLIRDLSSKIIRLCS